MKKTLIYLYVIVSLAFAGAEIAWLDHTLGWHNMEYSPPRIAYELAKQPEFVQKLALKYYPANWIWITK